jgi:hypothetical protein
VKISEKNLILAQKRKLRWQWFLHFYDHLSTFKNFVSRIDELGTGLFVFIIRVTGTDARVLLHHHGMAAAFQLVRRRRQQSDAVLLFLNFCGNADDHADSDG